MDYFITFGDGRKSVILENVDEFTILNDTVEVYYTDKPMEIIKHSHLMSIKAQFWNEG